MPKQQITSDDIARKFVEITRSAKAAAKSLTQTEGTGDAGTQGGQAFDNPMTAEGSLIVGGESGAATELAIGTAGQVLTVVSGVPTWADATGGAGGGSDYLYWTADETATEPVWLMSGGAILRG